MSIKDYTKRSKYRKVGSIKEVLENENTKYVWAVVRGRVNTVISLVNKNGNISIQITTLVNVNDRVLALPKFSLMKLPRVIKALQDLMETLRNEHGIKFTSSRKVY